jgi:hypothetical protein
MTAEKKPPKELLLMRLGTTETLKGPFLLTREAAEANAGKLVPISSGNFNVHEQQVGWGQTEVREDGIWLTGISWSKRAKDFLAGMDDGGQLVYLAPAFEELGHQVVNIVCVSLTATPSDTKATRVK